MPNKVLFVRHGIRGLKSINGIDCSLPFLNMGENLSLYGHLYSLELGKYIRKKYRKPTFIYADIKNERTIASAIAIAKGSRKNSVSFAKGPLDSYFHNNYLATDLDIEYSKKILSLEEPHIQEISNIAQNYFPQAELGKESFINEKGRVMGLIKNLAILAQLPTFSSLSKTNFKSDCLEEDQSDLTVMPKCKRNRLEGAFIIRQRITHLPHIVKELGRKLLGGIFYFLKREKLSVIVGHDYNNLGVLADYLGKTFHAPDYANGYIPPNSGFIFTRKKKYISVDILYLSINGKFGIVKYMRIPIPTYETNIEPLITRCV